MTRINRRQFVNAASASTISLTLLGNPGRAFGAPRKRALHRKNIEDLTTIEHDNYLHALNKLKDLPHGNANSYVSLSQIHNSNAVPCEHGSHIFLPWHRALLSVFEKALQGSDSPRTDNVTIPYYDFTKLPKNPGQRYPARFEDSSSLLSKVWTGASWVNSNRRSSPISTPFYSDASIRDLVTNNPNYSSSNLASGGSINGFAGGLFGGKGAWESPYHDNMHSLFIGGQVANPFTAADDPIFWSFHAFIDLVWHRWQQKYPSAEITGLTEDLRGMPQPMKVEDVVSIEDLGYDYADEPEPPGPFMALTRSGSFSRLNPSIAKMAIELKPKAIQSIDIKLDPETFDGSPLVIKDFKISETTSFAGFVFLHPKSTPFEPANELFVERFLAGHFGVWTMKAMPKMGDSMKTDLSVDLSSSLATAMQTQPGKEWQITVAVAPQVFKNKFARGGDFNAAKPKPQKVETGMIKHQILKGSK